MYNAKSSQTIVKWLLIREMMRDDNVLVLAEGRRLDASRAINSG